MEHGTMAGGTAAEVMALHQAGETAALTQADHIDNVVRLKLIRKNAVAGLQVAIATVEPELALKLHAFGAGLLQVPGIGLVGLLCILDQTELNGIITIRGRCLALRDDARTRFD